MSAEAPYRDQSRVLQPGLLEQGQHHHLCLQNIQAGTDADIDIDTDANTDIVIPATKLLVL